MDDILAQIRSNDFSYEEVLCTEKQLSEKYSVSRITAKRAITDLEQRGILYRKRGVGSFVTRNALSNLNRSITTDETSQIISLLLPFDSTQGGLFKAVDVINQNLNQYGCFLSLYISGVSRKKEKANIKLLLSQNISGLVYYPVRDDINLNLLNEFALRGVPVIIIDKSTDCPYLHNVTSDNFEGGRLLTEHLISLGHRNICFLTTAPLDETSTVRNRFGGYLHQLRTAGISAGLQNIFCAPYPISKQHLLDGEAQQLLADIRQLYNNGTTAFLAENDQVARTLKLACENLGLRVPEDVSICGFDNTILAGEADLTTINQNFSLIGEHVSQILKASLASPSAPVQKITVPVELVVRGSTGPAPVPHTTNN